MENAAFVIMFLNRNALKVPSTAARESHEIPKCVSETDTIPAETSENDEKTCSRDPPGGSFRALQASSQLITKIRIRLIFCEICFFEGVEKC